MEEHPHHVSGFFAHHAEAGIVLSKLVERGFPRERIRIFAADPVAPELQREGGSNEVLKDVIVDGTIGAAVGTGLGALGTVALTVANVSLFIASPLLGPLTMLGWGASLGGLVGAAAGASGGADDKRKKEGWLSDLVSDAISSGQVVLVAETRNAEETAIACEVIQAAVGDSRDVSTL